MLHPPVAATRLMFSFFFFLATGTPSQIARGDDGTMLTLDDSRARRKNTPGDQSMRRSIQDLVTSIDPNVRIEPEVEDVRAPSPVVVSLAVTDVAMATAALADRRRVY